MRLILFLAAFAIATSTMSAAASAPAAKPNVLFIAVDDLNDWVIGGRSGIRAPNIDRLLSRGTLFANAHCASPSCHPSRLAVMTGVRPSTSGIDHNVYSQPQASWRTGPESGTGALAKAVVLSRHFRTHGWRVAGAGKIFHGLQWVDGSENEPDAWDAFFPSALDQIPTQLRPDDLIEDAANGIIGERPLGGGLGRRGQIFGAHPMKISDEKMSDTQVADWAISQLQQAGTEQPLFLAVGFFRPHIPWEVPQKYFDLYPLNEIKRPKVLGNDLDDTHGHNRVTWHDWVLANEAKFQMWDRMIQGYHASITFMDAQLGRVLDALDASPAGKNTIVVLWSDHGMHFGEKQNWEKFTLWERSTRVPLIIAGPGVLRPGTRVSSPASLIDLYPTLCELTGVPIPSQCEGTSLVPQLRDPSAPRAVPAITTQTQGKQSGHTVRDERWRYIRYFDGFEELYDHSSDPDEFTNLANDLKFEKEKTRLRGWLERVRAPLDGKYPGMVANPRKNAKRLRTESPESSIFPSMNVCILTLLLLPVSVACAAETSPQLQEQLKRYPDADTNRDGVLTMEEAQAYAKVIRKGKKGAATGTNDDGPATAASSTKKPAPAHADVRYGPHERNVLDLWLAKSDRPTPLVVYIHGGGFVNGSKAGANADMINASLNAGVSFMAINYRFRTSAPIQDILRDCARSIQFVRSKAREYNLDPSRIASYGGSAGAGTSLWLAFHPDLADPTSNDPVLRESSRIVAAGALNTQATYNVLRWPEFLGKPNSEWDRPGETPAFYGAKSAEELARAKAILDDVDMLKLISRDDPPVFMFSAQPDGELANRGHYLHHPNHARTVKKACDEAGVPATVWFAMAEPRIDGDYQVKLREFLFTHLKVTPKTGR